MMEQFGSTDLKTLTTVRAAALLDWLQEYNAGPGQAAQDLTDEVRI